MANLKLFNSKNLSKQLENLFCSGKVDLAMKILESKELKSLLPNILNILRKVSRKKTYYSKMKVFSKTDLDQSLVEKLKKELKLENVDSEIIIDKEMSAGVKVQTGDTLVDATFETMLKDAVEKMIGNK